MTLLPQVRSQLDDAAHRKANAGGRSVDRMPLLRWSGRTRWRSRSAPSSPGSTGRRSGQLLRGLALMLLVLCPLAIGFGAVALLHGAKKPPANAHPSAPDSSPGAMAQPLLRTLGVLRRPQTKADLDPSLLRILTRRAQAGLGTPVISLIRLATVTPWGTKVFLVPITAPGNSASPTHASPEPAGQGRADSLEEFDLHQGGAGGGGCCATAADIKQAGDGSWGGPPSHAILIVPDGVTKVTLMLPQAVSKSTGYRNPSAVTAVVHNNVAVFRLRGGLADPFKQMIWYGPTGQVIKQIENDRTVTRHAGSPNPRRR